MLKFHRNHQLMVKLTALQLTMWLVSIMWVCVNCHLTAVSKRSLWKSILRWRQYFIIVYNVQGPSHFVIKCTFTFQNVCVSLEWAISHKAQLLYVPRVCIVLGHWNNRVLWHEVCTVGTAQLFPFNESITTALSWVYKRSQPCWCRLSNGWSSQVIILVLESAVLVTWGTVPGAPVHRVPK